MKKLFLAVALAAAIPLGGCKTMLSVVSPNAAAATEVCANTTADEKAWFAAEAFYNVPSAAYRSANERYKGEPRWESVKVVVKPKLQDLNRYRVGARSAYQACNMVALGQYSAAMEKLRNEVMPLIPQ